jgi:hypothetical protein
MARSWRRLLVRIVGYGFLVILLLAALAITFTVGWRPVIGANKRALTSRQFEVTPERLRRGDYLVHAVMRRQHELLGALKGCREDTHSCSFLVSCCWCVLCSWDFPPTTTSSTGRKPPSLAFGPHRRNGA